MDNHCATSPTSSSSSSSSLLRFPTTPTTMMVYRRKRSTILLPLLLLVVLLCNVSPSWAAQRLLRGPLVEEEDHDERFLVDGMMDEVQDHPVIYPSNSTMSSSSSSSSLVSSQQPHRNLASGRRTILVIRVLASDRSPSATASSLQQHIFTHSDSLANQMARCSAGVLQLAPAPYGDGGVVDVPVSASSNDVQSLIAQSQQVAPQYIPGITNLFAAANHVMFVLPQSSSYVAEAEIGGRFSWFNDQLAEAISVIMHEIGHNFGLDHAGISSDEYGDYSANMGRSVSTKLSPLMCFNAANNWQLGWYPNGRHTISSLSSPTRLTIGSFVNYPTTNPVLVKILSNTFLQYNDPSRHNVGSRANTNQVVLIQQESNKHTTFLAGLSQGQVYRGNGYVVEVCSIGGGTADISIGQSSTNCGGGGNGAASSSFVPPRPAPTAISWGGSTPRVTPTQPWSFFNPTPAATPFRFTPTPPTFSASSPSSSFGGWSAWSARAWSSLECTIYDSC